MAHDFVVDEAVVALTQTPKVLRALLSPLPDAWVASNEGPDTWSPFDVVGHLVHGEETDWMARAKHILHGPTNTAFEPFDRFAQFEKSRGKTLTTLLDDFARLRGRNVQELERLELSEADLDEKGTHPALGPVTLRELLATWVCHDYSHVGQISRVLAKRHTSTVGPWAEYLSILHR